MSARHRLPDQCRPEVVEFHHAGRCNAARIGRVDDGNLADASLNASAKIGPAIEDAAYDDAATISFALQFGTPIDVIRPALTRDGLGKAAGPPGRLLDILDE